MQALIFGLENEGNAKLQVSSTFSVGVWVVLVDIPLDQPLKPQRKNVAYLSRWHLKLLILLNSPFKLYFTVLLVISNRVETLKTWHQVAQDVSPGIATSFVPSFLYSSFIHSSFTQQIVTKYLYLPETRRGTFTQV